MNRDKPKFFRTGERTLRFSFQEAISHEILSNVHSFAEMISLEWSHYIEEIVPSYHTVTVFFYTSSTLEKANIEELLIKWQQQKQMDKNKSTRLVHIPVCYEESFSIDIDRITSINKLSKEEIIKLHTQTLYTVYMVGFLPGFPYLGDLNKDICVSRLDKPRAFVPKGSVGIGGSQTGIYPIDSPGGWNIIGRTPLEIYSVNRKSPFLLKARDLLQFYPISLNDYKELEIELEKDPEAIYRFVEEL